MKVIKTGIIDGNEYVGHVTEQGDRFAGSVHRVPEANQTAVFHDHSTEFFNTFAEAEEYVIREWNRRKSK